MIKNQLSSKILLNYLIFFSFLIHLITINFFPTNFEGGYGQYSNLFNEEDKIKYLKSYYVSQFNSYVFSAIGSILNYTIPFIDGFQSIKILSAFSYFFLGYGVYNFLKFYGYKYDFTLLILIIFLNSIIWTYGFKSFNDLFAFSLGIYAFSKTLINLDKTNSLFYALLLGVSIALKPYNLIFLIPLAVFSYLFFNPIKKINYILGILAIILFPLILLNIFTYNYLDFILAPQNEDLEFAIIGNDKNRDIVWVLNNFIFYIGYLTLVSLPFLFTFFLSIVGKIKKNIIFFLCIAIASSIYLERFFFISSELDLGPLQKFFSDEIYKSLIIFLFLFFLLFIYKFLKFKKFDKKQLNICKTILITILFYLFVLSFIKASQRYLILPIPFIFLIIFSCKQPKFFIFATLTLYLFISSILIANYYIVGKSSKIIIEYLKTNQLIERTLPNVITPHVYHLYKNSDIQDQKIAVRSSDYIVTYYDNNSIFSSKINFFGYEIKRFSVIKLN